MLVPVTLRQFITPSQFARAEPSNISTCPSFAGDQILERQRRLLHVIAHANVTMVNGDCHICIRLRDESNEGVARMR